MRWAPARRAAAAQPLRETVQRASSPSRPRGGRNYPSRLLALPPRLYLTPTEKTLAPRARLRRTRTLLTEYTGSNAGGSPANGFFAGADTGRLQLVRTQDGSLTPPRADTAARKHRATALDTTLGWRP